MPKETATPKYYACGHQTSNKPCPECQPNEKPMPDNWYKDYKSPAVSGLEDKVVI